MSVEEAAPSCIRMVFEVQKQILLENLKDLQQSFATEKGGKEERN